MLNTRRADAAGSRTACWGLAAAAALIFLAAHLPFLAPTLEDLDSVNFALGVRHFDPTEHQPHPPGYPFYIALGKISTAALDRLNPAGAGRGPGGAPLPELPGSPGPRADNGALGLAIWSAIFGALASFPLLRLFGHLEGDGGLTSRAALALTLASPLFWFTAVRPLTDVPGLAASLAGQALLAGAFVILWSAPRDRAADAEGRGSSDPQQEEANRLIIAGAFVSALAVGLRSQAVWLTMPLLALVLAYRVVRGSAGRTVVLTAVALAVGTALWAIPLVIFTGGIDRYLGALAKQGGEDFSGVDMFWTNRTPRRFVVGLIDTFIVPWASGPLAVAVLLLAALGFFSLLRRKPAAILVLAAGFLPYAAFHLLFHETVTTRYALPLIVPVAYLAVRGASAASGRYRGYVAGALVAASLVIVVPQVARYARQGSPVSRMYEDMRRHAKSEGSAAVLGLHRRVMSETRRAVVWELGGATPWSRTLPSPRRHEWLELVKYWTGGGEATVWFLAEPLRTDLALVDPASRRLMAAYRWPFPPGPFVGGVRPGDIDWYEIRPPAWFAGEGWSLTPETAGVAQADGRGPDRGPIEAWVRRTPGPVSLLVGGRNLGGPNDPVARIEVALDGRVLDTVTVKPAPGFFLRLLSLPDGGLAGEGRYARLTIRSASAAGDGKAVRTAIEQFDVQDERRVVFGYDEGWHELEYNPVTGRLWRWSSESAKIRIHGGGRDVRLRIGGEVSPKDFSRSSLVTVCAGAVTLTTQQVSGAFSIDATARATDLEQAGGLVTVATDQTFVPDERVHNGDMRKLGLRIYDVTIRPLSEPAAR